MPFNISGCVYPLVESVQSPQITFGNVSCGISCGDTLDFYIIFTREEHEMLKIIRFVVSLFAISLTPLYVCITVCERRRSQRSCLKLPFVYQCPLFISGGYIIQCVFALCPFLFGASIICNKEDSLTMNSFHNIPCTLTAIGAYIGIRLTIFYTCALSVSLALTLYYPQIVQRKRYFHLIVWTLIGLGIIPAVMLNSITGDFYFGICTTSLSSRQNLLVLDIIPLVCCVSIFSVCLLFATVKVFRQNAWVVHVLQVDKDVSSLFNRLLLYNFLQTGAVVVIIGDFWNWYVNMEAWNETRKEIFKCEMEKTMANQNSPDDYEICIFQTANLPRQSLWTYYILEVCALISVLGAIVFQCSVRVQQRSLNTMGSLALSFVNICSCRVLWRTQARMELRTGNGYTPSFTDMKREEITDTAVISSLDSTTSTICQLVKSLPNERTVM
jgi:hypothetical protein